MSSFLKLFLVPGTPLPQAGLSYADGGHDHDHYVDTKMPTGDPAIFALNIRLLEIGNHILQIRMCMNGTYIPMDTSPVILKVSNVGHKKNFRCMQILGWERLSMIVTPFIVAGSTSGMQRVACRRKL